MFDNSKEGCCKAYYLEGVVHSLLKQIRKTFFKHNSYIKELEARIAKLEKLLEKRESTDK